MNQERTLPEVEKTTLPNTDSGVQERPIHPVIAEVLADKEPDTISWVKG